MYNLGIKDSVHAPKLYITGCFNCLYEEVINLKIYCAIK